jgi:hypothetical protein
MGCSRANLLRGFPRLPSEYQLEQKHYFSARPLDTSDTLDTRLGNSSINLSIGDFPKPLSCPSKVSTLALTPRQPCNSATAASAAGPIGPGFLPVSHAKTRLGHSQPRICRALGISRSAVRFEPQARVDESALTGSIFGLAGQYGRYGNRRVHAVLESRGWKVSHGRVTRICLTGFNST